MGVNPGKNLGVPFLSPLFSAPFPLVPIPFLLFSFPPLFFLPSRSIPLLPIPFYSLPIPLDVVPLNPARDLEECCKLLPRGVSPAEIEFGAF